MPSLSEPVLRIQALGAYPPFITTQRILVKFRVQLDDGEAALAKAGLLPCSGRVEIWGGVGGRFQKLFDLMKTRSICIDLRPYTFAFADFPLDLTTTEPKDFRCSNDVASHRLDEDDDFQIVMVNNVPDPSSPEPVLPFFPEELPDPKFPPIPAYRVEENIDVITARVFITTSVDSSPIRRNSNSVSGTF